MSVHPPLDWADYKSTRLRHPSQLLPLTLTETELTAPRLGDRPLGEHDHDLTAHGQGEPLGERIIVYGQVLEEDGRAVTDAEGRYHFVTIKPGAYPWGNHHNAWRPQHIHFSLYGRAFPQRLVTQMYFPGDPLFEFDPIFNSVRDERARAAMICSFDLSSTVPDWALAYRFDIVLRGPDATPFE